MPKKATITIPELEPITSEVSKLRLELEMLKEQLRTIQESADKSKKYLFGNGETVGVDEEIRNIKRLIEGIRGALRWFSVTAGGVIITIILSRWLG